MELRLYTFVNFYLSQMAHGIQTAHAAVDLIRYYDTVPHEDPAQRALVHEWADLHKTIIVLNGGNNAMLEETMQLAEQSGLPCMDFFEDQQSLGGIRTCVAVVVPENVFKAELTDRFGLEPVYVYVHEDGRHDLYDTRHPGMFNFIDRLKHSRLA